MQVHDCPKENYDQVFVREGALCPNGCGWLAIGNPMAVEIIVTAGNEPALQLLAGVFRDDGRRAELERAIAAAFEAVVSVGLDGEPGGFVRFDVEF